MVCFDFVICTYKNQHNYMGKYHLEKPPFFVVLATEAALGDNYRIGGVSGAVMGATGTMVGAMGMYGSCVQCIGYCIHVVLPL